MNIEIATLKQVYEAEIQFSENGGVARAEATHEQRNRLASALFEDIIIRHNRVVAVRPRANCGHASDCDMRSI